MYLKCKRFSTFKIQVTYIHTYIIAQKFLLSLGFPFESWFVNFAGIFSMNNLLRNYISLKQQTFIYYYFSVPFRGMEKSLKSTQKTKFEQFTWNRIIFHILLIFIKFAHLIVIYDNNKNYIPDIFCLKMKWNTTTC